MRSTLPLMLAGALVFAACGDDEPELVPDPIERPAPQPAPMDTAAADTGTAGPADPADGAAADGAPDQPGQARAEEPDGERTDGDDEDVAGAADAAAGDRRAGRLYTVQVAAFTQVESARQWTARLQRQDLPAWTSMTELGGRTYYRVRVGAVPTVSEARRLGGLITARYEWPVWVAPITPADRVPEDAVADTRRVIGGD